LLSWRVVGGACQRDVGRSAHEGGDLWAEFLDER